MPRPARLIDLHCDWLLQYAPETTVFDPARYQGVEARLGQAEGYLHGTSAAVIACFRRADDWAGQADPWAALGQLIARVEAEFPGRILASPDDVARWRDDPDGLCWAVLGVEGFDALVRTPDDLERLGGLFTRGVRVFQPLYSADNALGGSSVAEDDRGLTDLGRAFLDRLADLAGPSPDPRPCPLFDLAHMNPATASDALDWFEADPSRANRVIPVYSHGALRHDGFATPRAITRENLARLRALGGYVGFSVGPPFYANAETLKAGIASAAEVPFLGHSGFEGIAIGTDFLGVDQTLPRLGNVEGVVRWLSREFAPGIATALVRDNARTLLARAAGVSSA